MNPYEVLEVEPEVEYSALRDAYRRLVRLHHPDLASNQERREQSNAQMQRINLAWQMIGEPEKRAEFDAKRRESMQEEARLLAARHELKTVRQQGQKARLNVRRKVSESKPKANSARSNQTSLKTPVVATSPTRQKVKKLKKARSPEEIRARNKQKLVEATHYWRQGKRADAIASCQSVLRNDFRNVAAREILGDIYLEMGDKAKALILFEQALALHKGNSNLNRKITEVRAQVNASGYEAIGRQQNNVDLKFQRELIQVAPVARPNSGEMVQEVGFWRRLRDKLGNRR
jgi:curved DNA-binding protein CbpA